MQLAFSSVTKKFQLIPFYQFKIPAAATGIPTDWKTNYYERAGESLVVLKQYKIDTIRSQERKDWSKQVLEKAKIEHLDKTAIDLAREK